MSRLVRSGADGRLEPAAHWVSLLDPPHRRTTVLNRGQTAKRLRYKRRIRRACFSVEIRRLLTSAGA